MNPRFYLWAAVALAMYMISTFVWNPARAASPPTPGYGTDDHSCFQLGHLGVICSLEWSLTPEYAAKWTKEHMAACWRLGVEITGSSYDYGRAAAKTRKDCFYITQYSLARWKDGFPR